MGAAGNNSYMRVVQCKMLSCNAFAPHSYLSAGLRIQQSLVLSMARFRLSSHNLELELGRHQGVVCFVRWPRGMATSSVQLWDCIFLWMTKPIYSLRAQLPLCLGGSVDLHDCH
jgi:hypothetical protein